jgi:flagella basal body P-ring formation protein FlgA
MRGVIVSALLLGAAAAAYGAAESPADIAAAVRSFLKEQATADFAHYQITVSALDPRLQLPACETPLKAFLPPGGQPWGNTSVGVRCTGHKPWTVYVPAAVKGLRKVVVVTRPLPRGAVIAAGDLALEEREVTDRPNAYLYDASHAAGMIAKRALPADTALSVTMLDAPLLVRRGQQVILLAQAAGIEVRMSGTALGDGAEGELVRVRNSRSKRIVEGLVIKPGVIRVSM